MTEQGSLNALLVVVGTRSQATAIEVALSARRIQARVHRDIAKVIEFGGMLGVHPFEVYVRGEDHARAKDVLVILGLPDHPGEPSIRSALGM